MQKKDIEVGEFYLAQPSKYSGPEPVLMLSLDPDLYAQSSFYSAKRTVGRRRIPRRGLPQFVGLQIAGEHGKDMDAWADGGAEPAIVRGRENILNRFNALADEVTDVSIEVPADLLPEGTRLRMYSSRDLVGPWVATRGPQLTTRREQERQDTEARKAASQRADVFCEVAVLAKTLGVDVLEARSYGELSHTYARLTVADLMALLKDAEAYRGRNTDLIAAFDADRAALTDDEGTHG